MITARPFSITNVTPVEGGIRFTLVVHTSLGLIYVRGCRYVQIGQYMQLMMPKIPIGGRRYFPIVKLPPHAHSLVRKLATVALEGNVDKVDASNTIA